MKTKYILSILMAGLGWLAVTSFSARATLTYETFNGSGVIYDSMDNLYWTQDGNISGQTYDFQDAQTWAANLTYAEIGPANWSLPTGPQFTSLYNQLDGTGGKYGTQVFFGPGPNDYASNVQPEYWTDTDSNDFNFYYGYAGDQPDSNVYPTWAVTSVPEPTSASLGLLALTLTGLGRKLMRK